MSRKLPPLTALRTFEVAARHRNFSRAAEELFVTHAAVSRQIRALEDWLGTQLFVRNARGVEPTEAAAQYQQVVSRLLDQLESATEAISNVAVSRLTVRVDLALATQWLVARLGRFQSEHPEVEVSLEPTYDEFDPLRTSAELGIQFVEEDQSPPPAAELLLKVVAFPVCSPVYLKGKQLHSAFDLEQYTLLHEESRSWWAQWLEHVGAGPRDKLKGPFFDETHLTLLAAEAGQGFALGDDVLVHDAILGGRLVRALDASCPSGSYYLVTRKGVEQAGAVTAFASWLRWECQSFARQVPSVASAKQRKRQMTIRTT